MAKCPGCKARILFNRCVTQPGAKPRPGDISICSSCGTLLLFGNEARPRPGVLPDEVFRSLPPAQRQLLLDAQALFRRDRMKA